MERENDRHPDKDVPPVLELCKVEEDRERKNVIRPVDVATIYVFSETFGLVRNQDQPLSISCNVGRGHDVFRVFYRWMVVRNWTGAPAQPLLSIQGSAQTNAENLTKCWPLLRVRPWEARWWAILVFVKCSSGGDHLKTKVLPPNALQLVSQTSESKARMRSRSPRYVPPRRGSTAFADETLVPATRRAS